MTSRTTSRPVNGSESECVAPPVGPLVCVVERTLQVCQLYAWHVEMPVASALAGTSKAIVRTRAAMAQFFRSLHRDLEMDEASEVPDQEIELPAAEPTNRGAARPPPFQREYGSRRPVAREPPVGWMHPGSRGTLARVHTARLGPPTPVRFRLVPGPPFGDAVVCTASRVSMSSAPGGGPQVVTRP